MTEMNTDTRAGEDLCSSGSSVDHSEFRDLRMSEMRMIETDNEALSEFRAWEIRACF